MNQIKDFLASVFDTSFEEMITPKIISIAYMLGIVVSLVFGWEQGYHLSGGKSFLGLVAFLAFSLFYILLIRVALEVLLTMFKAFHQQAESKAVTEEPEARTVPAVKRLGAETSDDTAS